LAQRDGPTGTPPAHAFGDFVRKLPMPVAVFDRELRYIAYSESWLEAYRLRHSDLVGRHHYEVFPEIGEEWKRVHRECLAGATVSREIDLFLRADGSTDYLRWTITPWHEPDGRIGGVVMYTEVISDLVLLARRLEEREDFIRMLFERSPIGLNLCRLDGLWLESNPAFLDIIGYTREEADGGLTYWDLTPKHYDDEERRQLESLERTGRYGPYEKEFIRKDGSLVPVRLSGFLVEREGERYIWSLIEDLTEHRKLERTAERERMKAIHASKLATLGEMAAGMAHELNNPLTIIDGYAGMLEELARAGDQERLEQAVASIRDATRRATRIVSGLRKFAREDDGERTRDVLLRDLVEDALQLCRTRIQNHGVALRASVETAVHVRCHDVDITQVLINLLNNGFHAALQGREAWVAIEARHDGRFAEVRVRDSGPGIPAEDRERIFQPFFTTKKAGEGTGLGLSISRSIVERLGGSLALDAEAPETCFVVRLPVVGEDP